MDRRICGLIMVSERVMPIEGPKKEQISDYDTKTLKHDRFC